MPHYKSQNILVSPCCEKEADTSINITITQAVATHPINSLANEENIAENLTPVCAATKLTFSSKSTSYK